MLWCSLVLLALLASVQGRAVNISNTWVLPEEGFPVFYRYFRDRISWYEADAVCQFHHANLVTVDTTAQYDAVRAYLKELDISSAVWVGLIRSNPDGDFTWTNYRGLSGDGYWSSAPDARAAPLCAAANPAADYRWEARACGGPTVASFICELPVPQWALGDEGCMVRALPALTVLYLPESAAVQLTADCGLAGVKRVQCTGNVKREDLLKDLSCVEEDEISSTLSVTTISWSANTDTTFTDQDLVNDGTIHENITTGYEDDEQPNLIKVTALPFNLKSVVQDNVPTKQPNTFNRIFLNKNINLDIIQNNNLQSNDIPKLAIKDNFLTSEHSDTSKLEDEKQLQHKMLHVELARLGNFETIFTQPTDHFVPPLVMAKSKISDDMTVLSLEEKHAQQLAEQRFAKHNNINEQTHTKTNVDIISTGKPKSILQTTVKPLLMEIQINKNTLKKDKVKLGPPKKYNEKYDDPKGKIIKITDKALKFEKMTEISTTQRVSTEKELETTTINFVEVDQNKSEEDPSIDLTVIIKEPGVENEEKVFYSNYSGDVPRMEEIQNETLLNEQELKFLNIDKTTEQNSHINRTGTKHDITPNHEVMKITIIKENDHHTTAIPTISEISTKMPVFKNDNFNDDNNTSSTVLQTLSANSINITDSPINNESSIYVNIGSTQSDTTTSANDFYTTSTITTSIKVENDTINENTYRISSTHEIFTTISEDTTQNNITDDKIKNKTDSMITSTNLPITTNMKINYVFNFTDNHEDDNIRNKTDTSEVLDDFQSPLLSAVNEPLHRPNRSRRPQQPSSRINKFNPFRILG